MKKIGSSNDEDWSALIGQKRVKRGVVEVRPRHLADLGKKFQLVDWDVLMVENVENRDGQAASNGDTEEINA
jgi:hypothetical protein